MNLFRKLFGKKGCEHCTEQRGGLQFKCITPAADMNGANQNYYTISRFHIDLPTKTLCYYGEDENGYGMDDFITINFCPRCGRKL